MNEDVIVISSDESDGVIAIDSEDSEGSLPSLSDIEVSTGREVRAKSETRTPFLSFDTVDNDKWFIPRCTTKMNDSDDNLPTISFTSREKRRLKLKRKHSFKYCDNLSNLDDHHESSHPDVKLQLSDLKSSSGKTVECKSEKKPASVKKKRPSVDALRSQGRAILGDLFTADQAIIVISPQAIRSHHVEHSKIKTKKCQEGENATKHKTNINKHASLSERVSAVSKHSSNGTTKHDLMVASRGNRSSVHKQHQLSKTKCSKVLNKSVSESCLPDNSVSHNIKLERSCSVEVSTDNVKVTDHVVPGIRKDSDVSDMGHCSCCPRVSLFDLFYEVNKDQNDNLEHITVSASHMEGNINSVCNKGKDICPLNVKNNKRQNDNLENITVSAHEMERNVNSLCDKSEDFFPVKIKSEPECVHVETEHVHVETEHRVKLDENVPDSDEEMSANSSFNSIRSDQFSDISEDEDSSNSKRLERSNSDSCSVSSNNQNSTDSHVDLIDESVNQISSDVIKSSDVSDTESLDHSSKLPESNLKASSNVSDYSWELPVLERFSNDYLNENSDVKTSEKGFSESKTNSNALDYSREMPVLERFHAEYLGEETLPDIETSCDSYESSNYNNETSSLSSESNETSNCSEETSRLSSESNETSNHSDEVSSLDIESIETSYHSNEASKLSSESIDTCRSVSESDDIGDVARNIAESVLNNTQTSSQCIQRNTTESDNIFSMFSCGSHLLTSNDTPTSSNISSSVSPLTASVSGAVSTMLSSTTSTTSVSKSIISAPSSSSVSKSIIPASSSSNSNIPSTSLSSSLNGASTTHSSLASVPKTDAQSSSSSSLSKTNIPPPSLSSSASGVSKTNTQISSPSSSLSKTNIPPSSLSSSAAGVSTAPSLAPSSSKTKAIIPSPPSSSTTKTIIPSPLLSSVYDATSASSTQSSSSMSDTLSSSSSSTLSCSKSVFKPVISSVSSKTLQRLSHSTKRRFNGNSKSVISKSTLVRKATKCSSFSSYKSGKPELSLSKKMNQLSLYVKDFVNVLDKNSVKKYMLPENYKGLIYCAVDSQNIHDALNFVESFSKKYTMPTDICNSIINSAFLSNAAVSEIHRSFTVMSRLVQEKSGCFDVSWENIEGCLKITLGNTDTTSDKQLLQSALYLQLIIEMLKVDLYTRDLTDSAEIRHSHAYKLLGSSTPSWKSLVYYLNKAVHAGQCRTSDRDMFKLPDVLLLLQDLFSLCVEVSSSCVDCANTVSSQMVTTYKYLPTLGDKKRLIQSVTSPLLQYKLVQHVIETCYDVYQTLGCGFPDSIEDIIQCFFKVMPLKNPMTPPTTPTDESHDGDSLWSLYTPADTQEIAMLCYYGVTSYLRCSNDKLHMALRRRSTVRCKNYTTYDTEVLDELEEHVGDLESHLIGMNSDLTPQTSQYLLLLACHGTLGT